MTINQVRLLATALSAGLLLVAELSTAQIVPRIRPNLQTADIVSPASLDPDARPALAELDIAGVKHFAVAWSGFSVGTVPAIYLALVDAQGNVTAGPSIIAEPGVGPFVERVGNTAIAADRDGNFAVAWTVINVDADTGEFTRVIQYRLFAPQPSSMGEPVALSEVGQLLDLDAEFGLDPGLDALTQRFENIDLASSAFGRYALVLADYRAEGETGVYFKLFDFDVDNTDPMNPVYSLQPASSAVQVTTDAEFQAAPKVDINPNNERSVVVWRTVRGGIRARRMGAAGAPDGDAIQVVDPGEAVSTSNYDPDVSIGPDNNFWIVWERYEEIGSGNDRSQSRILMSRYDSAGTVQVDSVDVSTQAPTNAATLTPKRFPRIRTTDIDGHVGVTWQQSDSECFRATVLGVQVQSFNCPVQAVINGTVLVDAWLDAPPGQGSCQVRFPAPSGSDCRRRTAIEPHGAGQGTGWLTYFKDRQREFIASAGETLTVDFNRTANPHPTDNRCVEVVFGGDPVGLQNRIRVEQRCAQDNNNCVACADQISRGEGPASGIKAVGPMDVKGLLALPEPVRKGGGMAEYDVHMRWLQSDFGSDEATVVPQFQVNDHVMGNQGYPVLGMFRNGEMLVSWAGEFSTMSMQSVAHQRYTRPVMLTINDVGILEGALGRATASFTVGASKPYPDPLTGDPIPIPSVELLTADGTATFLGDNPDYERTEETIEFPSPGPVAAAFDVEVLEDLFFEDTESFFVDMFNEANAIVVRRQGVGAIIDNDPPATVMVLDMTICEDGEMPIPPVPPDTEPTCDESTMTNPNATVTVTVQISPAQQVDGSVEFQTADGVLAGNSEPATSVNDYEAVTGDLQFLAGAPTQAFITIDLKDDLLREPTENFRVELTDATDLTLGMDVTGVITILNDDTCDMLPTAQPAGGGMQPPDIPIDGGVGYICVTNPLPDDCPWFSELDFEAGAPMDWITAEDFPQAVDVGDFCGAVPGATGYIRYEADANMPPMPNAPNLARDVPLLFVQGEADPPSFQIIQEGGECALQASVSRFDFFPVAGTGSFDVTFNEPPGGAGICDSIGWDIDVGDDTWIGNFRIGGIPATSSAGPRTVEFEVQQNPAPAAMRQGFIRLSGTVIEVNQEGPFFDHFDDSVLPIGWNFDNIGNWSEAGTGLLSWMTGVASTGNVETTLATPAFPGCLDCEISSAMRMDTFGKGTATLYAWYQDQDNHVALTMNEFDDRFRLIQRVGGVSQTLRSFDRDVLVGTDYDVSVAYDTSLTPVFLVNIEGDAMCPPVGTGDICEPVSTPPSGTVGFAVESTTASFNVIQVTRGDGAAYPSETIFEDGLESQ